MEEIARKVKVKMAIAITLWWQQRTKETVLKLNCKTERQEDGKDASG
jgi:hypothetical protein